MATTRMVFNLVANDQASFAFDKLARNVELSNLAIERHNAQVAGSSRALDDNSRSVDRSNSSLAKLSGTITTTSHGFGLLATSAVAFGPAVGAAAAVATAGIIGLGGIVASTGAALGVFGLTAKSQFDGLSKGYKQIQTLKEQAAAAPAGSAQQAADYAKLAKAQADYTKTFGPAAAGMNNLQTAWANWKKATAGQTNEILAKGLNLLAEALPKLRPLFDTGAAAAGRFLDAIQKWMAGGGLDRAVTLLNNMAKAVLPPLEQAMRNLAVAAGAMAPQFASVSVLVANGIAKITGSFANWVTSKGPSAFTSFMQFVTANGPKLWDALKNIADAAVKIAQALNPLAPVSIAVAGGIASLIASAPPGAIQAAAVAFVAYSAGVKGLGIAEQVGLSVQKLAKAVLGLNIAMNANLIGIIVLAIVALGVAFYEAWQKSAGFRDFVKGLASDILAMGIPLVQGCKVIVDAVLGLFGSIIHGAATAFGWIPGLGPKLKGAAAAFDGFKQDTDNALNGAIQTMQRWQDGLNAVKPTVQSVSATVVDQFNRQAGAATNSKAALDRYTDSVRFNGVTSNQAQQARYTLIADLVNAGVKSSTAMTDVNRYTDAIRNNGLYSDQANAARKRLIQDILNASSNAVTGKRDTDALTTAVQRHGLTSDAYRNARQRLINDLIASGVNANTARGLVDNLGRSVANLPGQKNVKVNVNGSGQWSIAQGSLQQKLVGYAAGGRIPGYGGGDIIPALLEPGETVVDKRRSQMLAPVFRAAGVPGYAGGGIAGMPMWTARSYDATVAFGINAMTKAMTDAINQAISTAVQAVQASRVANVGAGVSRWSGVVSQALAMLGMSQSFVGQILFQMNSESGGNPNAINLWDSNAAAGHPSMGLMQVIGPTFSAYHVPGTSWNIYDPLANVAAAINYARARYGPSLGALGSGHGYRYGSWDVPVTGPATVHKGEMILPTEIAASIRGALTGGSQPDRIERLLTQLIHVSAAQGEAFARALDGTARRARVY